jgi:HSP20 family protein
MALKVFEPLEIDIPDRWRRWLDLDTETDRWLRIEEVHEDGEMIVRAELPGIDPDKDVEVTVSEGVLRISAKREESAETNEKGVYRSEFRYGMFARDFVVPAGVDHRAVTATYRDGILEVRMPWVDESQSSMTKVPVVRS